MLGSLDPAKILVILVIALIVLGPERLPRAARQLGAAWRELTRLREQVTEEVRSVMPDLGLDELDLPHFPRSPAGAVSSFVRDLTSSSPDRVGVELEGEEAGEDAGKVLPVSAIEHSGATADGWEPSSGVAGAGRRGRRARTSYRSARPVRAGETAPEGGVLVVVEPDLGELAVVFDDPAMN